MLSCLANVTITDADSQVQLIHSSYIADPLCYVWQNPETKYIISQEVVAGKLNGEDSVEILVFGGLVSNCLSPDILSKFFTLRFTGIFSKNFRILSSEQTCVKVQC